MNIKIVLKLSKYKHINTGVFYNGNRFWKNRKESRK